MRMRRPPGRRRRCSASSAPRRHGRAPAVPSVRADLPVDDDVRRTGRVVPLDVAILLGIHRSTHVRARPRRRARRPRASRTSYGASTQTRTSYASRNIRWSAQTPSTTTSPSGRDRCAVAGTPRAPVPRRRNSAGSPASERVEDLGPQAREVELLAVPELVRAHDLRAGHRAASVDLPAPPRPPMPTKVKPRVRVRGVDQLEHRAGRPRAHASRRGRPGIRSSASRDGLTSPVESPVETRRTR